MLALLLWLFMSPHCHACLGTGICPHCLGTLIDTRDRTGKCIWGGMWLPRELSAKVCWCRECKGKGS